MTFAEITRTMLSSMDFFELRRTAARYSVPFQGIRRQQLIKEVEKAIVMKSIEKKTSAKSTQAKNKKAPMGATSAKPKLKDDTQRKVAASINTFSSRAGFSRTQVRS
ncbi:hypothetical protein MRY82_09570 [bacterium]|nr:hypothetical protein [bacterium]